MKERGEHDVALDLDVKGGVEDLGRVEGEDCNQNTCMIKTSFLSKKQKRVSQNVNLINPPSNNVIKCIISQQLERMSFCLYSP